MSSTLLFIPLASGGSGLDWQQSVLSILNDPPGAPVDGDRYIVDTVPTGAWVGHANAIAQWNDAAAAWNFAVPNDGFAAYVEDVDQVYLFDGAGWAALAATPLATTAPVDSTFAAAVVGVGVTAARDDHKHDLGTPGAPLGLTVGGTSNSGAAAQPSRADHTHALTAPAAPADSTFAAAAAGVSTAAARADHKHDLGTPPTPAGAAAVQAGIPGVSTIPARADHVHNHTAASPVDIGETNTAGSSLNFNRADHRHAHGNQSPQTALNSGMHGPATAAFPGFMSAADFSKLDAGNGITYTPAGTVGVEWAVAVPTTIGEALNRIAVAVAGGLSGPIA